MHVQGRISHELLPLFFLLVLILFGLTRPDNNKLLYAHHRALCFLCLSLLLVLYPQRICQAAQLVLMQPLVELRSDVQIPIILFLHVDLPAVVSVHQLTEIYDVLSQIEDQKEGPKEEPNDEEPDPVSYVPCLLRVENQAF